MKNLLKKILPNKIIDMVNYTKLSLHLLGEFLYDWQRYTKSCWEKSQKKDEEDAQLAALQSTCHALEKGFCMPDFHTGFGEKKLQDLIPMCNKFIAKFGKISSQLQQIIKVIFEYRLCHQLNHASMPESVALAVNELLAKFPDINSNNVQIDCCKETYFASNANNFADFAKSRHSCRNFTSEPVAIDKIRASVKLAQTAPSACNRQSVRVITVSDKEAIRQIFANHGGNRGFGHTVDKLLLIASYLPTYSGETERNWAYVDCGIFAMNLLYALHFHHIGAVILNWSMRKKYDVILRRILTTQHNTTHIPLSKHLVITCMIAIGNVPDKFKVCSSPRKDLNQILVGK